MPLERVLLAVGLEDEDRRERLARTVVDVAGPAGATVTLLHVFTEEELNDTISRLGYDSGNRPSPDEVAGRLDSVRAVARLLDEAGVEADVHGSVGERAATLVAEAESSDADLLVIGGERRSPAGKAVFGSTAQQVLLNAPCPVTYVRGE